ncbi:MAG: hypothetical protein IT269_14550 [Saprospiraceae bacterium]|nr:hypothetical protein [Saprospiraceae bacterium]
MHESLIFSFLLLLFVGCQQPAAPKEDATSKPVLAPTHFEFSKKAPERERDLKNWCWQPSTDAQPINAEKDNLNRRYAVLTPGMAYRVGINAANSTAAFILRANASGVVELFTSNNFPNCLSNFQHFTLSPDGASLHYDNHHYIKFDSGVRQVNGATQFYVDMPADFVYPFEVKSCATCR